MKHPLTLLALVLLSATALAREPQRFTFGAFGDMPYLPGEEVTTAAIIGEMNTHELAFVVHVGDIKSGGTKCDDAIYTDRRALFSRSRNPIIVVPGDNDWTDCHRHDAGGYDPLERLAHFREIFDAGSQSLGARMIALARQSDDPKFAARFGEYRENVRWAIGDVLFIGLNVPGSNNNLGRTPEADAEYRHRSDAVNEWLDDAFVVAESGDYRAVVIFMQANPGLDGKKRAPGKPDGYDELRRVLVTHAGWFKRPVLFVHGDTHRFRVDRPFVDARTGSVVSNLLRAEVYGSPKLGWVEVEVDTARPDLFAIRGLPQSPRPEQPRH